VRVSIGNKSAIDVHHIATSGVRNTAELRARLPTLQIQQIGDSPGLLSRSACCRRLTRPRAVKISQLQMKIRAQETEILELLLFQ
jgi:hypothetical protein